MKTLKELGITLLPITLQSLPDGTIKVTTRAAFSGDLQTITDVAQNAREVGAVLAAHSKIYVLAKLAADAKLAAANQIKK